MDVCAVCGNSCVTLYVVLWVVLCVTRLFNACVCLSVSDSVAVWFVCCVCLFVCACLCVLVCLMCLCVL